MIEKDFDISFAAEQALREKQIQQNYRPIIAIHNGLRRAGYAFPSPAVVRVLFIACQRSILSTAELLRLACCGPLHGRGHAAA